MRYPKAKWLGNGKTYGEHRSPPFKIVMHTTETTVIPSYSNGDHAPHLTFDPKTLEWVQHSEFELVAGALRNESGGVQTNADSAIQVEMICYSDKRVADKSEARLWVGHLSEAALRAVGEFWSWCNQAFGVKLKVWDSPKVGNACYGSGSPCRMPPAVWDEWNGICGHAHVPENAHWDPGVFDFETALTFARPGYKGVLNVPNTDWARTVIDDLIEDGVIITSDDFVDDWNDDDFRMGRLWTLQWRMMQALKEA